MLWGSGTDYEGRRLRHWYAPESTRIFALAGLWKDEEVPAFALLSRKAEGAPAAAGCRSMPVVVADDEQAQQDWLHGNWDAARALIEQPCRAALAELGDGSESQ
jgi:putative SOS response-associated peptidase YedK